MESLVRETRGLLIFACVAMSSEQPRLSFAGWRLGNGETKVAVACRGARTGPSRARDGMIMILLSDPRASTGSAERDALGTCEERDKGQGASFDL